LGKILPIYFIYYITLFFLLTDLHKFISRKVLKLYIYRFEDKVNPRAIGGWKAAVFRKQQRGCFGKGDAAFLLKKLGKERGN
jgi:hypothetical protein